MAILEMWKSGDKVGVLNADYNPVAALRMWTTAVTDLNLTGDVEPLEVIGRTSCHAFLSQRWN